MNDETSANGIHTSSGKFVAGNPGGPGNPHAGQVARLRVAMLEAVTPDDLWAVTRKLVEMALDGDLKAIELLLNRTLGKADSGPQVAVQVNTGGTIAATPEQRRAMTSAILERLRVARSEGDAAIG